MKLLHPLDWVTFSKVDPDVTSMMILDHMEGFTEQLDCRILSLINNQLDRKITVECEYLLTDNVKKKYPNLDIRFNLDLWKKENFIDSFEKVNVTRTFDNFLCSFNGHDHVGRRLLLALLHKRGWVNDQHVTKNFRFDQATIDGHVLDYTGDQERYYRKFFLCDQGNVYYKQLNSINYTSCKHKENLNCLKESLSSSFVHLVSETLSTGYYPFVTEKFLYSVVTQGLFIANAQPGWHKFIKKYFGFKLYDTVFDYTFDTVSNPVKRMLSMTDMLSKFSHLSAADWHDLYLMEKPSVEFNLDHFLSGDYEKHCTKFIQTV
jgi:hypothetical protein